MSTQVNIPAPFGISISSSSSKVLNSNNARKFLQVQNQSKAAAIVTIKFDSDFVTQQAGVQTLAFSAAPDAGGFTLTFNGQTTATQAYNVSAANLQTAMQALSSVGAN